MDIDVAYLDSANWQNEDMHERFRWLRQHDPVRWSEKDDLWLITSYEDVVRVSKGIRCNFTSAEGVRPGNPVKIGLIDEGEPRHGQLRGLINKGFTPRMVTKLEEVFLDITKTAIDSIAREGHGDFVEAIAVPLPLRLIAANDRDSGRGLRPVPRLVRRDDRRGRQSQRSRDHGESRSRIRSATRTM